MPTMLPGTTTQVIGQIAEGDSQDFFSVGGLAVGSEVSVGVLDGFDINSFGADNGATFTGSNTTLYPMEGATFTVGLTGAVTFGIFTEGNFGGSYSVTIDGTPATTANVPVPTSAALLGLGVAAMATRRRKHGSSK